MDCPNCGHPEEDHVGYWQNPTTGAWDVVIPGKLCYYEENHGHCEDLCPCPGFDAVGVGMDVMSYDAIARKAGIDLP